MVEWLRRWFTYKTVKKATFTLSIELLEDLDVMSKEMGKKKTEIVSEALEMYMDYQDIQLAKKRLNDSSGTIKADDFFKELGTIWIISQSSVQVAMLENQL